MVKRMLIDAVHPEETRVVITDDKNISDFDFVTTARKQLKGNIYLAKITRVEPSLQAAFVEYGGNKQGFLPFSEIHPDYYQIPVSDRKRLMAEAEDDSESQPAEEPAEQPTQEQIDASAPTEQQAEQPAQEQEHPAYLTGGAIEVNPSDESDHADANEPFASSESAEAAPAEGHAEEAPAEGEPAQEAASGEQKEEVETLPNEEEEMRPKKSNYSKRYKIQEVVRRGQIVLVQVIKEERGNKGVSLTTFLSLAGRYVVLMPNSPKDGGISRKIASPEDRKRLKAISTELRLAKGMSVIIRTAGMERTRAEIKRDYDYLVKVWNQVREDTLKSNAPALIYEESDLIKRSIRDQYTSDIDELIVEGGGGYEAAKEFMKLLLPSHTPKIKLYEEATPLFYAYNIEEQLLSMHDPSVKLRSGGYIVINPTEALISIDVNSGRSTGERNIEETATKTNLEAANEIARQLRLRDLAGLIVIDFIDMMESRNRRAVEKALKDALKLDRAKIQLGRISPFGLLEMSRQRLRPSISETNMMQCPHCAGRGYIRSHESMSIQLVRAIEKEAATGAWNGLRLFAPQEVVLHLLNTKRDLLRAIETRHNITIQVLIGPNLTASEFNLEKMRRGGGGSQQERGERNRDRDRGGDRDRNRNRDRDRHDRNRDNEPASEPMEMEAAPALGDGSNIEEVGGGDPTTTSPDDNHRGARRRQRGGRGRRRGGNRGDRPERGERHERGDRPEQQPQPVEASENTSGAELPNDSIGNTAETPHAEQGNRLQGERPPREGRRRQRGGRGRRRWKERDGQPGENRDNRDRNREPREESQGSADADRLPAFTRQSPIAEEPKPREPEKVAAAMDSTPRDPNAPTKKGWWQKMIELDE